MCPPSFRVFAAQNPLREGGGRKGLPRSFLNRFTRVAVESMGPADLEAVRSPPFLFFGFRFSVRNRERATRLLRSRMLSHG